MAFSSFKKDQRGFALVAALLLVVVAGMVGVTVLQTTSTEIQISGHSKAEVQRLYWAEAGIAEARRRLRGAPSSGEPFIGDPMARANSQWSAYILTSDEWIPSADRAYRVQHTNYIPTSSSQTGTMVVANTVQPSLSFWAKIRHKTEFDAEQAGHRPATSHYADHDGNLRSHSLNNVGQVIYYGYPTPQAIQPVQFTGSSIPMGFPVEMITAAGGHDGAGPVIEVEVLRPPGPKVLAALYAKGPVTISGKSTITGHDTCQLASGLPPIYTNTSVAVAPGAFLQGAPMTTQIGPLALDLAQAVNILKSGATQITHDLNGQSSGSSTDFVTLYANTGLGSLTIRDSRGFGILLVDGNLILEGNVEWYGLLVSTGGMIMQGAGAGIMVQGAIWAGHVENPTGRWMLTYDSCKIKSALLTRPLRVWSWREVLE
ncbi:MAG: hypothetical protein GKS05_09430 [Nitrospirales bacterium]|nr:hypothetical protein [Nitrospirales bacterium]